MKNPDSDAMQPQHRNSQPSMAGYPLGAPHLRQFIFPEITKILYAWRSFAKCEILYMRVTTGWDPLPALNPGLRTKHAFSIHASFPISKADSMYLIR